MAELDVSERSAVIALRLLGRFAVSVDGQPPLRFSARKSCALLAYLALRPDRRADRERLATLLWGDRSDELARQNLRQCLVSLRRDLPPVASNLLAIDGHSIGLRSRHLSVDVHELAALADATDLCRLERALDLYRGPFLADLGIETEAFEEWARTERARIEAIAAPTWRAAVGTPSRRRSISRRSIRCARTGSASHCASMRATSVATRRWCTRTMSSHS
jgi:DNA-binding SARP family transcriptional activator